MNPRDELRTAVTGILQRKGDESPFGDGDPLTLTGRLDSVDVIELVSLFESRFGVDFAEAGFEAEEFESVDRMVALLQRAAPASG